MRRIDVAVAVDGREPFMQCAPYVYSNFISRSC